MIDLNAVERQLGYDGLRCREEAARAVTKHQTKVLNSIRALAGSYVGFIADPTIRTLIKNGFISFSPTAHGAGYCAIVKSSQPIDIIGA